MQDPIVVEFPGKYRDAEVLGELQALENDWMLELDDAVAASSSVAR